MSNDLRPASIRAEGAEAEFARSENCIPHEERLLHKIIKEAHRLNIKERELALVILQAIGAWNGMDASA